MKIIHDFKGFAVEGDGIDNFLLANRIGGYVSLSGSNISKYQGVFFNDGFEKFRAIENIKLPGEIKSVRNKFWCVERERDNNREVFFMPHNRNAFVYELDNKSEITLTLDCRKINDFEEFGKEYKITKKDGKIIINFSKKDCSFSMVILPDAVDYEKIGKWREIEYSYDKSRKSLSKMHVYDALKLRGKNFIFAFSTDEKTALNEAEYVKDNLEMLKNERIEELGRLKSGFMLSKEIKMAYLCAQNSLNELVTNINGTEGIFAGFYWFDQFWSRDELVSLKALMLAKRYKLVKQILFKNLKQIQKDGRLPNRLPATVTKSADSVGWLFKRISDFIEILEKENLLARMITHSEALMIKNAAEKAALLVKDKYSKDRLIVNETKDTWMDSVKDGLFSRNGARIEIQALQLGMYNLMGKLCTRLGDRAGQKLAEKLEKELAEKVRRKFWNGHYLNDGADDRTIRPNVFIAYYVYPKLLTRKQWIECFANMLPRLWVDVGYSSIDTHHQNFQPYHTGEDDKSYHNGDSWYWINCLATLCLFRLGKFRFYKYIQKPVDFAAYDILWHGIPGSASEISSARDHRAFGCFDQAWSNAMFIELVKELF